MKKYKLLIIDEVQKESLQLKRFVLDHCPYLDVTEAVIDIFEVFDVYMKIQPDILIINVNKDSEELVFTALDNLPNNDCEVIFTSPCKDFGVKAIQYNVTDYLLKPIALTKFKLSIAKAIINIQKKQVLRTKLSPQHTESGTKNYPHHIAIPNQKIIKIISTENIVYAEAEHRYTIFHLLEGSSVTVSKNLGYYEDILDPSTFFRIHNKYIININMVQIITKTDGLYCKLLNNKSLPISKRRQDLFFKSLHLRK